MNGSFYPRKFHNKFFTLFFLLELLFAGPLISGHNFLIFLNVFLFFSTHPPKGCNPSGSSMSRLTANEAIALATVAPGGTVVVGALLLCHLARSFHLRKV
jgi:hypothetical protein